MTGLLRQRSITSAVMAIIMLVAGSASLIPVLRAGDTSSAVKAESSTKTSEKSQTGDRDMNKEKSSNGTELATFGAGCFWGVEETFRQIPGVTATAVGYMGGTVDNPSYRQVCAHNTGHAEVCQVEYDPNKVTFEELLEVFWRVHDPTQVNRQGPDIGDQYRSAIFYHTEAQKEAAEKSKRALSISGKFDSPIATKITPAATFWRAEEYHQRYLQKKGLPACGLN